MSHVTRSNSNCKYLLPHQSICVDLLYLDVSTTPCSGFLTGNHWIPSQKQIFFNTIVRFTSTRTLTFEKQAPICTFGVGGKPLLGGLGGVCLLLCFLGGTGGQATKSGALISWLFCSGSVPNQYDSLLLCMLKENKKTDSSHLPLILLSVLPLSLSDRCLCPLILMLFTKLKISSTEERRLGEPFNPLSLVGLEDNLWISHLEWECVSESCTGSVALRRYRDVKL